LVDKNLSMVQDMILEHWKLSWMRLQKLWSIRIYRLDNL